MANIERILNIIGQRLGFRPKAFPTREEAEIAEIINLLKEDKPGRVINLKPSETNPDNTLPDME